MSPDRSSIERLLGTREMRWFIERVRGRILASGGESLSGTVRLKAPTHEQRSAVWQLVGRPVRAGSSLNVDLAVVEEILRRGPWPAGLADAVQTLTGPVIDHGAKRAADQRNWDAARDVLAASADRFDGLTQWWNLWCAGGGLKRAARAEADRTGGLTTPVMIAPNFVAQLAAVLDLLPAEGELLSVLARQATGDAHGLDANRPLGRTAVAVVRAAVGARQDDPARHVWDKCGVLLSAVTSTVLCLGVAGNKPERSLAGTPRAATGAALEEMRISRMPVVLTLDQVRSGGIRAVPTGGVIHVCENPSVVEVVATLWDEAASKADETDKPVVLVCTSGQPSTAVTTMLKILAGEGAAVLYHGDFDWAGLQIAQSLRRHVDWHPWRFTAADYLDALGQDVPSLALRGVPSPSPWDPDLAAAMAARGIAVEEEAVAGILAADLIRSPRS